MSHFRTVKLLLALVIVFFVGISAGWADTLTVTNSSDYGAGSLRQAIADAAAGDTIDFSSDLESITLSEALVISKNITIMGSGADTLSINGGGNCRIFEIESGASVDISNLSVVSGDATVYARGKNGGGILLGNNAALSLNGCTFEDCRARLGGAITCVNGSSTNIENCTFKNNEAVGDANSIPPEGYGGGIYTGANSTSLTYLSVTDSNFYGNKARDYGGGIYNIRDSNATVTNCNFSENTAGVNGGGIWNYSESLTLSGCTFSNNSVTDGGGGIYNVSPGLAVLLNCTITRNIASSEDGNGGGGIYNKSGYLKISNCTISDNYSPKGAGISGRDGTVALKNTIIAFNNGEVSRDFYIIPDGSCVYGNGSGYNLAGNVPESWFMNYGDIILSADITSSDVFSGLEDGPEVGAPGDTEKMQILALKAGALAVDAAHWFDLREQPVSEDQRGVSRPQGYYNDIGAFELELASYSITTSSTSGGGSISPESADVPEGMDQSFTITPYNGFVIEELYADRQRVDFIAQGDTYIFNNVSSDHELEASFMVDPAMMEDAGIEDFGITGTDKGPLADPVAITKQDLLSISVEKVNLAELGAGIPEGNFVTGLSFEMEFDSPDMGTAVTQLDLVLEISRDLLGPDTCSAIDGGSDLEEAFFENVSLYKIVSPDVYDLFEVASEDQDPYDFFEVSSDDSGYYVSMIIVIADETAPEGEACVQALVEGQDSFFFVYDGAKDGSFDDPFVALRKGEDDTTSTGTGDGGCNMAAFSPAPGLLFLPLLFLLRK